MQNIEYTLPVLFRLVGAKDTSGALLETSVRSGALLETSVSGRRRSIGARTCTTDVLLAPDETATFLYPRGKQAASAASMGDGRARGGKWVIEDRG